MIPVLTAEEYRRVDQSYTGDLVDAMERAGYAVALAAARHGARYGTRVAVLTGPGNNGGDGYVAARYLKSRGVHVEVFSLAPPKTGEAQAALAAAKLAGVRVSALGKPVAVDLVVDALFGGGVRRGLPDEVLSWMNTPTPVIAVDFPTGLDPDTGEIHEKAFRATETVSFSTPKTGHLLKRGPERCGRLTIADIGINGGDPSFHLADSSDASRPLRKRRAHKWSAGAVLILGGSAGMVGASVLAGRSALNFGAGTCVVSSPDPQLIQAAAPELLSYSLQQAEESLARFDVVVAGCGLSPSHVEAIHPILVKARKVVLDAGALTPDALAAARHGAAEVVITPHDGEFPRVAGMRAGSYAIRSLALSSGIVVLRKGNPTMVTDGGMPVLVTTGGPELATIGSGDVLAGMIGALWARGLGPHEAAVSGAYWHGVAGAALANDRTVTAGALVDQIALYAR